MSVFVMDDYFLYSYASFVMGLFIEMICFFKQKTAYEV